MKKFETKIYYSGYCTHIIDAENEEQAIKKARNFEVNKNEVLANLENWHEADEALRIEKLGSETSY